MLDGFATYEIKTDKGLCLARFFLNEKDEFDITEFEKEVCEIIENGYDLWASLDALGNNVDPYKAAEKILADHYGYAKMIEANYTWRAGIVY